MKRIKGDLIRLFGEGDFDILVHGCNCAHAMGFGFAEGIRDSYPEAYAADKMTIRFDKSKMGTYSYADIWRDHRSGDDVERVFLGTIVNAYIQYHWKGTGKLCDYDAVRTVFRQLKRDYGNQGKAWGIPAIGSGSAGGDWHIVSAIIEEEMGDEDIIFVEFDGVTPFRCNFKRNMR